MDIFSAIKLADGLDRSEKFAESDKAMEKIAQAAAPSATPSTSPSIPRALGSAAAGTAVRAALNSSQAQAARVWCQTVAGQIRGIMSQAAPGAAATRAAILQCVRTNMPNLIQVLVKTGGVVASFAITEQITRYLPELAGAIAEQVGYGSDSWLYGLLLTGMQAGMGVSLAAGSLAGNPYAMAGLAGEAVGSLNNVYDVGKEAINARRQEDQTAKGVINQQSKANMMDQIQKSYARLSVIDQQLKPLHDQFAQAKAQNNQVLMQQLQQKISALQQEKFKIMSQANNIRSSIHGGEYTGSSGQTQEQLEQYKNTIGQG